MRLFVVIYVFGDRDAEVFPLFHQLIEWMYMYKQPITSNREFT